MLNEQVRQFIDQATQSIQAGQFDKALQLIDQALALDPEAAEAYILKGIALSQTGQPSAATEVFRRAVDLDPMSAKAHYNLAVHLYSQGEKTEALQSARTAASVDLNHAASRQLALTIETELGLSPTAELIPEPVRQAPQETASAAPFMQANTNPYMKQDVPYSGHSIPFVEKLGGWWTAIAWILVVMSLAGGIGAVKFFAEVMGQVNPNSQTMNEDMARLAQHYTGLINFIRICGFGSIVGTVTWSLMDHLDQRNSFLWLIPNIVCTCCGCAFITLPIYMLAGRNKQTTSNV